MKAKVSLTMMGWWLDGKQIPLIMTGSENGESTGSPSIDGTIDVPKDRLYELLKAQVEEGRNGVFLLKVVD